MRVGWGEEGSAVVLCVDEPLYCFVRKDEGMCVCVWGGGGGKAEEEGKGCVCVYARNILCLFLPSVSCVLNPLTCNSGK